VGGVETEPIRRIEAPRWLAESAERFRASGAVPAVPRLAATVVLLRPRDGGGLELYVQRRAATMAFAPGYYAFPGGSVDPADHEPAPDGDGAFDEGVVARVGLPAEQARAVLRAAVREVAEETGVRLQVGALAPWARWITPEFEPRRFDTYFFVAALPTGQSPRDAGGESDHAAWVAPGDALGLLMLPPTEATVAALAACADIDAVLADAAGRELSVPVSPTVEVDADGVWLRLP
jgi:8-oxo-dGTP pyrophosphatase MutT (NUDIX family)